jgi:hypothetical protein
MTTVKEAIKMLSEYLDQDEEICIAWWSKELFENQTNSDQDSKVTEEAWNKVVLEFDDMTQHYQGLIYDIIVETITEYGGWIENE